MKAKTKTKANMNTTKKMKPRRLVKTDCERI